MLNTQQQAVNKQRAEDEDLAARMAYETKEELKREEANFIEAKTSLKTFLLSNEVREGSGAAGREEGGGV